MIEKSSFPEGSIKCLDKGFVRLVDSMGGDNAIVQAARVSYGKGTTKKSQDRGLIRYLMRHRHSTPFEMVEFKFHAKMPIFVARQWVRHRTANINEYSLRYSEARDDFYFPDLDNIKFQSSINKQGRGKEVSQKIKEKVLKYFKEISKRSFEMYDELNNDGVARELARAILPVNLYTEWYWKNDLHNLLHFIGLRSDSHAQYEIQVYSDAMSLSVKNVAPYAWEAYKDYRISGMYFSKLDQDIFKKNLPNRILDDIIEDINYQLIATINEIKPRKAEDLFNLYVDQGGEDIKEDFLIKWNSGKINKSNVRELRELKQKIVLMKK
tara:strand:- start:3914 stop:4885 length:972 start_codon:yes stop_codon:yes gene_type:complete